MNVVFLSEGHRRQASADHRVYLVAEELERRGHATRIFAGVLRRLGPSQIWWVGPWLLLRTAAALRPEAVLVLHKTAHLGVFLLVVYARLLGARVVFDFDDAIHLPWRAGLPHPLYGFLNPILRLSHAAWCGSHALLEHAARHTNALWVPTPVLPLFLESGQREDREVSDVPAIVWMGNGALNVSTLALLVSPLTRLARVARFRFRILSSLGSDEVRSLFQGLERDVDVDYGWNDWRSVEDIAGEVARAQIGVMPLADTPWNRGKCAMKGLECMGAGLAVVFGDVGENRHVAGDDEHALLADGTDAWYRQLRRLVSCPSYRRRMAERGRARVHAEYSEAVTMERVLRSLADLEPAGKRSDVD